MFKVDANTHPLERLVSSRKRVTYQLVVKDDAGRSNKRSCEFQTKADFVFSAPSGSYHQNERVQVRATTLKGPLWHPCVVTFIEEHNGYSLFQMSLASTLAVAQTKKRQA